MRNRSKLLTIGLLLGMLFPGVTLASVYGDCTYGVNQVQNCETPTPSVSASSSSSATPSAKAKAKKSSGQGGSATDETAETTAVETSPTSSLSPSPSASPDNLSDPKKTTKASQMNVWTIVKIIIALGISIFGIGYLYGFIKKQAR